ncbi:hypothetical protein RB195_018580 [Necator americanus]|uniref:Reverse transcriptase domain-containing protein n=1 Tax=Necator americanus TaxID=51031 RepID=A0ABR1CD94_NECAM
MYKVLERIILDRLIKHHDETARDDQANQMFIVRKVIEIWQRYSKPMHLAILYFEAAFDSPHRARRLKALHADGIPGMLVSLFDNMNQRTRAIVRLLVGCTTLFEVVTGVRQGAVTGPFRLNFIIGDIIARTVEPNSSDDVILAPLGRLLTDLEWPTMLLYSRKKHETPARCQPCIEAGCSLWTTSTPLPKRSIFRKRKFWTEVVKEDLRPLGVDRYFRRDVRFRRIWNNEEWIESVQALAEDRGGWVELCSRKAHIGGDAGNRIRR